MFCQAVVFRVTAWYNMLRMQHMNASKTVRLPSLVETISLGFGVVNRCLWVLAIPVLLDLVYWLGPRLSVRPLAQQLLSLSNALSQGTVDANVQQFWSDLSSQSFPFDLAQLGLPRQTNMFAPKYINLLTPALTPPAPPFDPPIWQVGNLGILLLVQVLGIVGSLLVTSIYLLVLSDALRGGGGGAMLRRWARGFAASLGIGLVVIVLVLLGSVPLAVVVTLTFLVSPTLAQLLVVIVLALFLWLLFTASFSLDAVFMSDSGPFRALLTSLYVVQRSLWSAAGLFLLSWVILTGLSLAWQILATTTAGLLMAIVGSAYISSGLAAAHLIFYRDRSSRVGRQPKLSRS